MALLDIEFEERTAHPRARLDRRRRTPSPAVGTRAWRLYTTAIETFATTGAHEAVKQRGQQAVGVANTTDFLRPHRAGRLQVEAVAVHEGRSQQLWQVDLRRPADGKLVARGHVRLQNVETGS
jgi:uncharacterized protein (TIGR00369 family)